jgi:hypothetical protein
MSHAGVASAKGNAALVLPTVTPLADCSACPTQHRPDPEAERELALLARELDSVLVDSAQDLGLTIDVSARPSPTGTLPSEASLVQRAASAWVFSPRIALSEHRAIVRIVAVAPGSQVLLVRTEELKPSELEVRAVLMMRDLVHASGSPAASPVPTPKADEQSVVHVARSRGRAVLAFNSAILGGYVGFALQRAGGSSDARLMYPLIALGTGIGLGASMIVAEEWDVGIGDAWYLSAGMWWPLLGAVLVAHHEPEGKRLLWGAAAAGGGVALATASLSMGSISEGSALIAHSGGAFGTMLGGVTDLIVQGRKDVSPTAGMGVGAISGVVVMGAVARFTPSQPASRVLLVDLSAGLGALTGAAVASPLIFGDDVSETRTRLWLSTIALGTFVGAGVGLLTTAPPAHEGHEAARPLEPSHVSPFFGAIATTTNPDGSVAPVPGAGIQGLW